MKKYCWYFKPNILSRPILKHEDKPEDNTPTEIPGINTGVGGEAPENL